MHLITIKSFNTAIEAYIIKNRLEAEGIPSFVQDENIVTLNPMVNFAVGGVRLQVDERNVKIALEILEEIEKEPYKSEEDNPIRCPKCNSTKLYSDFKTIRDGRSVLAITVSFFFTTYPIYSKSVYKCKDCGKEFQ